MNSLRFNFYPWVAGNILRDRLPFTATWTASLEEETPITARVDYVGEGAIHIGGTTLTLEPAYERVATRTLPIPFGRHRIEIQYRFDDGYRTGQIVSPGPLPTFRLQNISRANSSRAVSSPLLTARPDWRLVVLGWLIDAALFLLLADIARVYLGIIRPDVALILLLLPELLLRFVHTPFSPSWKAAAILLPIFAVLVGRHRPRRLLFGYLAIVLLSSQRTELGAPRFHAVEYRSAGDDPLTYESFARSILDERSLKGGESLFYYQPFSRYETFLLHLFLGDGDTLVAIARVSALHFSLLWMLARIWPRSRRRWFSTSIAAAVAAPLLGLLNAPGIVAYVRLGGSELLTWVALPAVLGLLFWPSKTPGPWLGGTMLLGASIITRTNQLPGWIALFLVHQVAVCQQRGRMWWREPLVLLALMCVPLMHNLYYGGVFIVTTTSAGIPQNLELPPKLLFGLATNLEARRLLSEHLKALVCVGQGIGLVALCFHLLQGMWLLSGAVLLATRRRGLKVARLLWPLPLVFLSVHLFYQVRVYYPRHIVIGHMAMGLVAIYGMCVWARSGELLSTPSVATSPPDIEGADLF